MTTPIEELKIRARLLCNALDRSESAALERATRMARLRRWASPQTWTLSLCLNIVSAETGFEQWDHARRVLSGEARIGDDMGTLWYDESCASMMNRWFSSYADARASLQQTSGCFLLPYGRQFIVADSPFIEALGLSPSSPHWKTIGSDLLAGYGKPAWQALLLERLHRMRQRKTRRRPTAFFSMFPMNRKSKNIHISKY